MLRRLTGLRPPEELWRPVGAYQRFAYACGLLLLASGAVHVVVFLVKGGAWEGPISWRKPILFAFSFGITVLTLTWFLNFIRVRKITGWLVTGLMGITALAEVALISMQKWRGVASHFNDTTAFDEAVFGAMGTLVLVFSLVTIFLALRSFGTLTASPSLAWAIRLGLVLLLVSNAVGVNMIAVQGNTFGTAGPMKVPHAVTLHAAQVLPALAVLLGLPGMDERRRLRMVVIAACGYGGLIAVTLLQTYSGRGTLEVGAVAIVLAVAGLSVLAATWFVALRSVLLLDRHEAT